jgi:hypothetical protein
MIAPRQNSPKGIKNNQSHDQNDDKIYQREGRARHERLQDEKEE